MAGHVRMLGILWLALSAVRLLPGLALVLIFGGGWSFLLPEMPSVFAMLLFSVGALLSLSAVAGIVTGWGLLAREGWVRPLAVVMGCLNLIDLPLGTSLGIYTLWVLRPETSQQRYRGFQSARAVAH